MGLFLFYKKTGNSLDSLLVNLNCIIYIKSQSVALSLFFDLGSISGSPAKIKHVCKPRKSSLIVQVIFCFHTEAEVLHDLDNCLDLYSNDSESS